MRKPGQNSAYFGTEKRILNALSSILRDRSSVHIKVKDVASVAGIASSSFYIHYKSLDDVISRNEHRIVNGVTHIIKTELVKNSSPAEIMKKSLYFLYRHRDYLDIVGYSCNVKFSIAVIMCLLPVLEKSWPKYPEEIRRKLENMLVLECCAELNLWWNEKFSFNKIAEHAGHLVYISVSTPKIYASMYA